MKVTRRTWPDAVVAVLRHVPLDLQWRVEAGLPQTLPATICRGCGQTEFRVLDAATVACLACSTTAGADTERCFHGGYVNLGAPRTRIRILVRPLEVIPRVTGVVTVTAWRSDLDAGHCGPTRPAAMPRPRAIVEVRGSRDWRFACTGSPGMCGLAGLPFMVIGAVLRELGCDTDHRCVWRRPDGEPVYRLPAPPSPIHCASSTTSTTSAFADTRGGPTENAAAELADDGRALAGANAIDATKADAAPPVLDGGGTSAHNLDARGVLLRNPTVVWARGTFAPLLPGGHACVFGNHRVALDAEDAGFEVRDCITVLGPTTHRAWLLRKPIAASTIAAQMLSTATGGLWIDGCRVGGVADDGRWPTNLALIHLPECRVTGERTTKVATNVGFTPQSPTVACYGRGMNGKVTAPRTIKVDVWACAPGCASTMLDQQASAPAQKKLDEWRAELANAHRGEPATKPPPKRPPSPGPRVSPYFPQFKDEAGLDAWLLRLILAANGTSAPREPIGPRRSVVSDSHETGGWPEAAWGTGEVRDGERAEAIPVAAAEVPMTPREADATPAIAATDGTAGLPDPGVMQRLCELRLLHRHELLRFTALWAAHAGEPALVSVVTDAETFVAEAAEKTLDNGAKRKVREIIGRRLTAIASVHRARLHAAAAADAAKAGAAPASSSNVAAASDDKGNPNANDEPHDADPPDPAPMEAQSVAGLTEGTDTRVVLTGSAEVPAPRSGALEASATDPCERSDEDASSVAHNLEALTAEVSAGSLPASGECDENVAVARALPETCRRCGQSLAVHPAAIHPNAEPLLCYECYLRVELPWVENVGVPFGGRSLAKAADAVVESSPKRRETNRPELPLLEPDAERGPLVSSVTPANAAGDVGLESDHGGVANEVNVGVASDAAVPVDNAEPPSASAVERDSPSPEAAVWTEIEDVLTQETRDMAGDSWGTADATEWKHTLIAELRVVSAAAAVLPSDPTVTLTQRALRGELRRTMVTVPPRGPIDLRQWRRFAMDMTGGQYTRFVRSLPLVLAYNVAVGHPLETGPRRPFLAAYQEGAYELLTATNSAEEASRNYLCHSVADILRGYHTRLARLRTQRRIARITAMRRDVEDACAVLGLDVPPWGQPVNSALLESAHKQRVRASHPDRHGGDPEREAQTSRLNVARDQIRAYNQALAGAE